MDIGTDYNMAYDLIRQNAYENNAWSAQMAANNMNYQLNMANTAHQREVADLKAAGLNPILSAHGNGAAVGSPVSASPDFNSTSALTSILKDLISSNTAIGVANAKAAGGAYDYHYGNTGKDVDKGSGPDPTIVATDPTGHITLREPTEMIIDPKSIKDFLAKGAAAANVVPGPTGKAIRTALGALQKFSDMLAEGISLLGDPQLTKGFEQQQKDVAQYYLTGF